MATIRRAKANRADLALWDGVNPTVSRPDSTGGTTVGLAVGNEVDVLQVFGQGTARTAATLSTAKSFISSNECTIVIAPGDWTIDENINIPSNISVRIPSGVDLQISSGKTLTINGAIYNESPSFYSGSGTLTATQIFGPHITAAELAAGVTPTNYSYKEGNVLRYGADPSGVASSVSAFQSAALLKYVYVPNGTYLLNTAISGISNQIWYFDNATLYHTDNSTTILSFVSKQNFAILGAVILKGTLTVAATHAEVGLYIEKCWRYRVENVEARLFTGVGIKLSGGTTIPGSYRGERGQFIACTAFENTVGLQIDIGAASEYNDFIAFHAAGNTRGVDVAAGNNNFIGSTIVDNTEGVYVRNGTNHAHGIFAGVAINHNSSYNIKCENVTNGQTFVGCHVYGDSAFTGYIWFVNSKGCHFTNGTIDAPIQCDGTTGLNVISGNFIAGATNPAVTGTNPEYLVLRGNFTGTGPWGTDDASDVYVQATRGSSTQSLSTGTTETVVFNNEEKDNRNAYDPSTGVFTAPYAGRYSFVCNMYMTAASGVTDTYFELYQNNTTSVAFAPLGFNSTNAVGCISVDINMNAGDTMRVRITSTGTTPVVAIDRSRLTIKLLH